MRLRNRYEYPSLFILILAMVGMRLRGLSELTDPIKFRGVDAYYHYRASLYTVKHYPHSLEFDPYTNYPHGKATGQFGTIYDQFVATISLAFGGGSETTGLILLFMPVVFGTLTILPVYSIAKTVSTKAGALFGATILALQPGVFLQKSMVGHSDHNIVEVFLLACSVALLVTAFESNSRRYAILSGIATGLYLLVWPPGIFLLGIYGIAIAIAYLIQIYNHRQTWRLTHMAGLSMPVTAVIVLLHSPKATFEVTGQSLLQAVLPLTLLFFCLSVYLLDRFSSRKTSLGLLSLGAITSPFAASSLMEMYELPVPLLRNFLFFGTSVEGTISETAPFPAIYVANYGVTHLQAFTLMYGFSLFTGCVGILLFVWHWKRGRDRLTTPTKCVLLALTVVLACAALTQIRFNYYLVIPVSIWNAYLFGEIATKINPTQSLERLTTVGMVGMLISASLFLPLAQTDYGGVDDRVEDWKPALEHLHENTTHPELSYTESRDYEYPNDSFGVLSWWDYGHWITLYADRPAVSNPFQDNRIIAARVFLAPDTSTVAQSLARIEEPDSKVEYIIVDRRMLNYSGQLYAIAETHPELEPADVYHKGNYTDRFKQSFLYRLWHDQTAWDTTHRTQTVRIYRRP